MGSVTRADLHGTILDLVNTLNADLAEVVRLRMQGMSFAKIGVELGISDEAFHEPLEIGKRVKFIRRIRIENLAVGVFGARHV